jgi:hypothetical protein
MTGAPYPSFPYSQRVGHLASGGQIALAFSSFICRGINVRSTLTEIEAAADALPLEKKKKLPKFLVSRVNAKPQEKGPADVAISQFDPILPKTAVAIGF